MHVREQVDLVLALMQKESEANAVTLSMMQEAAVSAGSRNVVCGDEALTNFRAYQLRSARVAAVFASLTWLEAAGSTVVVRLPFAQLWRSLVQRNVVFGF